MPGLSETNKTRFYDFSVAPDLAQYRFSDDPAIADENGPFIEVPITSFNRSVINKLTGKAHKSAHKDDFKISGDGSGIPSGKSSLERLLSSKVALTLDDVVPSQFISTIDMIDKPLLTVMSHPKLLSTSSYNALQSLIDDASGKYYFDLLSFR
jgi:hypothetical protein